MKTAKLFAALLAALFMLASCELQALPEEELTEEDTILRPGVKNPLIYISQDLESDLLLRKVDRVIVLPPDSGSFTISAFFRKPFATSAGVWRDELHIRTHETKGDDFLRLKYVQPVSKIEVHYTYEYADNRSDANRIAQIVFMDNFNMPVGICCYGSVSIVQPAYEPGE